MSGKQINLDFQDMSDVLLIDKKGLHTVTNDNSIAKSSYNKEIQILELLFVQYVFMNDDGKLSFKEKLKLKYYYNKYNDVLVKEDLLYLNKCLGAKDMSNNIYEYIVENDIKLVRLEYVFTNLKKHLRINRKYNKILQLLQSNLVNKMNSEV